MLAWIPLFPLLGFLVNGCWYAFGQMGPGQKKAGATLPGIIATASIGLSFIAALVTFFTLTGMSDDSRVIEQVISPWISVPGFELPLVLRVDSLSTLFTLVITGVGTLIHLYSIGYMHDDESPGKFFAYLNLFCFAMLVLVLGASLPILFFGWEGVGLCSYLLIGYWYTDIEKAKAGKKAFVVNRIGDLGFLLGMFLIWTTFGTLDFVALKTAVAQNGASIAAPTLAAIGIFLFIGCSGKSAQIPLYVWLPDAMAGPTPVSALIHAATMVTSGIYLIARLNFLYALSPVALEVVAIVGGVTAFFAATMAITQTDIKKVLAYSTVSQLGYMFLACGVGVSAAGVFHVITHAFFKALLFLGAGSVILGMHHEQDILKMGGLRTKMPITFATFLVGWLAICGMPPFSGFFSKDEILWVAYSSPHGSIWLWALAALTAVMTAFYMTRLFALTFLGGFRGAKAHGHGHGHGDDHGHEAHEPHESPWVVTLPLVLLAVASFAGGFMGIPHSSWLVHWLEPVIPAHHELASGIEESMEWVLMGLSVLGGLLGMGAAFGLYRKLATPTKLAKKFKTAHRLLNHKWYVDEVYEAVIIRPLQKVFAWAWKHFDVGVIDRMVVGLGRATQWSGNTLRLAQSGSIQIYAWMLVGGVVFSVGYLIYGMAR